MKIVLQIKLKIDFDTKIDASTGSSGEDQPPRKRSRKTAFVLEENIIYGGEDNSNNSNINSTLNYDSKIETDVNNKMQQQQLNSSLNGASSSSSSTSSMASQNNGHVNNNDVQQQPAPNGNVVVVEENGVSFTTTTTIQPAQQPKVQLDKLNRDIVRLMGQHLRSIGLKRTADLLMQESGCNLEHPAATKFRQHVLSGEWPKADHDLQELQMIIDDKNNSIIEMKFLLLEQKYLEFLEAGKPLDALHVLRNELTPLQHNTPRVHQLSSYMMCANNQELYKRANWEGEGIKSRTLLMDRLQKYLPPSVMLPPNRLKTLLTQAVEMQYEKCPTHDIAWKTDIQNVSLLADHTCSTDNFPIHCLQVLNEHCDEVWYCRFSPDGLKLATGSKDTTVIIWDVDPNELTVRHRKTLEGHTYGVSFITWSPDSKYLVVGGSEECPEVWIWNIDEGKLHNKIQHASEDSLTCAAFSPDGKKFVTGGLRGQFYLCDIDGVIHGSLEGIRVVGLAFRADNKTVLAADTHHRIRSYVFDSVRHDNNLIQEQHGIMTFTVNSADRLALLNISTQGLHLWDLQDKCLVRRFQGIVQGNFTISSCFGGVNESFVASGSEDCKVYIWHIKREEPILKLSGHIRTVNCVHWNPKYPALLASVSDDYSVRIWGPKRSTLSQSSSGDDLNHESNNESLEPSWNMGS